jgi:hypothetical protein
VLLETLMLKAAKKHRPQTLALCQHTGLQAFWLVSINIYLMISAFNKHMLMAQALKSLPTLPATLTHLEDWCIVPNHSQAKQKQVQLINIANASTTNMKLKKCPNKKICVSGAMVII